MEYFTFQFGFNYGWMLLIFALTAAYAVICPIITPFGLFYLVMKHGVDRYNLYYAYKRFRVSMGYGSYTNDWYHDTSYGSLNVWHKVEISQGLSGDCVS